MSIVTSASENDGGLKSSAVMLSSSVGPLSSLLLSLESATLGSSICCSETVLINVGETEDEVQVV